MQAREETPIRIAVIDYQSCAFAPTNLKDKHFLSPPLMQFLRGKYHYFVGHTFRCFINIDDQRDQALQKVPPSETEKFSKSFPTIKITKHIAKHTGVPCLTVATLDDLVTQEVGKGYQDLIKYELENELPKNAHVLMENLYVFYQLNNEHLLLIAKYIAGQFPGRTVFMDIIDDDLKHCNDAFSAVKQAGWPDSVKLNKVYRFSTKIQNNQVTEIVNTSLAQHTVSLFKPVNTAIQENNNEPGQSVKFAEKVASPRNG